MPDPDPTGRKAQLREAIRQHLVRFPLAADTMEGVSANWLSVRAFPDAPRFIEAVLGDMVEAGELGRSRLPDGRFLYLGGALPSK